MLSFKFKKELLILFLLQVIQKQVLKPLRFPDKKE